MKIAKFTKKVIAVSSAIICLISSSSPVFAYSDSTKANLPNTSYYVQSNVWQSTTTQAWQTNSFKVSAKLYGQVACVTTKNASTIKTSWSFSPSGVGVSCKGVSAGTASGKGFSGYWQNTNTWISDMSGTFSISGVPLYSSFTNTATAIKDGVKATATADCFRFW